MITAKQREGEAQPETDLKIPNGLCDKFLGYPWANGYKQQTGMQKCAHYQWPT